MDIQAILTAENFYLLFKAALISLGIALVSVFFGVLIGIIIAFLKLSKNKILKTIGTIYVEVIRGTPMLLQILFFFLGFPVLFNLMTGSFIRINIYVCGIMALSINSGAYCGELIRSAIVGIDKGQYEASKTLGLSYIETMRFVILPQALRRIVAPIVSEFIMLIKDSSLLGTIGVIELLQTARTIGSEYYNYLVPLVMATCFYLVMTSSVSYFASKLERKFQHD